MVKGIGLKDCSKNMAKNKDWCKGGDNEKIPYTSRDEYKKYSVISS